MILTWCEPSDPLEIYEHHKEAMAEDFLHHHRTRLGNVDLEYNDDIYNLALNDLQDKVISMGGRELSEYGLPQPQTVDNDRFAQGIGYRPGSADMAGTSYERLNYHKNKALKESGIVMKGVHVITEMEAIADKIDEKDSKQEGSIIVSEQYKALRWPYMVDYSITASMTYQFIMSPLMCKLL